MAGGAGIFPGASWRSDFLARNSRSNQRVLRAAAVAADRHVRRLCRARPDSLLRILGAFDCSPRIDDRHVWPQKRSRRCHQVFPVRLHTFRAAAGRNVMALRANWNIRHRSTAAADAALGRSARDWTMAHLSRVLARLRGQGAGISSARLAARWYQ